MIPAGSGYEDLLAELGACRAEIERLRERNAEHEKRYEALEALGLRHDRAAIIEECAAVLIAIAISARKEKP